MKNVRRSLLTSSVSLLLCFVMLIGTTFAWFTDVAVSANNIIQTGKLDANMYWNTDNGESWTNAEGLFAEPIFDYDNWEPGYTVVRYIKVANEGNLAFQYRMYIDPTGVVGMLADVIDVSYDIVTGNEGFTAPTSMSNMGSLRRLGTLSNVISENISIPGGALLPEGKTANGCYSGEIVICIAFHMQESAGNEYQGKSIGDSFGITLHATQYDYESDSFGTEYDSDAQWPERPLNAYASRTLGDSDVFYGALANEVAINGGTISATIPADVKVESGATSLSLTVKSAETDANLSVGEGESARGFDVHISGISADNTKPMIVNLGAVLPAGIDATELKLYHTENGTPVQMTRVASTSDFAIHNQYVYDAATGEVTIYVATFSIFSAVKSNVSRWENDTVADTTWYNDHDTEFTLSDVADFLGFRDLVDAGNNFAGKTVKLASDIDLNNKLFNPIGGGWAYNGGKTFNGTFDGGKHTIYNIRVNGWELDETGDKHSSTSMGAGLFSSIHNATIKNLLIVGADMRVETTSIGVVVGCAQGECTFENIVVSNAILGNYQMRNGGIVGDIYVIDSDNVSGEYSHTFKDIVVDSTVKLCSMWGDFDTGNGGVIGGKYGSATVLMQNVIVACELDVFSDVTAAYQWYAYRRCGMLIGYTGQNSPKQATNAAAEFLTCENVTVYYGDWVNYTYYQFTNQDSAWQSNYPWVRAQESTYNGAFSNVRYGNPVVGGEKINTLELAEEYKTGFTTIKFDQLYGGGQGVYGTADHKKGGVTTKSLDTNTIYFQNNWDWENLKIYYWYEYNGNTWTTVVDGILVNDTSKSGEKYAIYQYEIPANVAGFYIEGLDGTTHTVHPTDRVLAENIKEGYIYWFEYVNDNGTPRYVVKSNIFNNGSFDAKDIYVVGDWVNEWSTENLIKEYHLTPSSNGTWTATNVTFEKTTQIKLYDSTFVSEGSSNFGWINKEGTTNNVELAPGKYTITYSATNNTFTFVMTKRILYLQTNSNWRTDGARFAVYCFGSGETWVSMTSVGDGIYRAEIDTKYPNVIFCRMKGSVTTNNWNNKWNQTGDLNAGDGSLFTLPSTVYDGYTGGWSKYKVYTEKK